MSIPTFEHGTVKRFGFGIFGGTDIENLPERVTVIVALEVVRTTVSSKVNCYVPAVAGIPAPNLLVGLPLYCVGPDTAKERILR